jgi:hypothetical protein
MVKQSTKQKATPIGHEKRSGKKNSSETIYEEHHPKGKR